MQGQEVAPSPSLLHVHHSRTLPMSWPRGYEPQHLVLSEMHSVQDIALDFNPVSR